MKVKVVGSGPSPWMYRAINAETGEDIDGVVKIQIEIDPHKMTTLRLEIVDPVVEVSADVSEIQVIKHVIPMGPEDKWPPATTSQPQS